MELNDLGATTVIDSRVIVTIRRPARLDSMVVDQRH